MPTVFTYTSPPTLELTSQQVPVIRVDGYLSVCFFDVCRQPERDLSCLRLLTHESFEVRCNGCPLLITEMGGSVHEVSVCPVKEHSRRYNSSRFFLLLRTEARDYQVRESISCFGFRHDQYLTSSRLVTENFFHLGLERGERRVVFVPHTLCCQYFIYIDLLSAPLGSATSSSSRKALGNVAFWIPGRLVHLVRTMQSTLLGLLLPSTVRPTVCSRLGHPSCHLLHVQTRCSPSQE